MRNQDIRRAAKEAKVHLWQIAEELGMQDSNFSRRLRHELPAEEKAHILAIIQSLAKGA